MNFITPPPLLLSTNTSFEHLEEGGETLTTQWDNTIANKVVSFDEKNTKYIREQCMHYNDILSIVNKTVKQIHTHTCIIDSNFFMGYRKKRVCVYDVRCTMYVYADPQAFIFWHWNINQKLFRGIYSFLSLNSRCVKTKKKISRNRSVKVCAPLTVQMQ